MNTPDGMVERSYKEHKGLLVPVHDWPYYSRDEMRVFGDDICVTIGLSTLKNVIEHFGYALDPIKRYIKGVADGRPDATGVRVEDALTDGQVEYHKKLYKIMFVVPLRKLPLYINEEPDFKPVVAWRLRLAK